MEKYILVSTTITKQETFKQTCGNTNISSNYLQTIYASKKALKLNFNKKIWENMSN